MTTTMSEIRLFRLAGGTRRNDAVEAWFRRDDSARRTLARKWFEELRAAGEDVVELLHDDLPTACVGDLALGYVGVFTKHVNVGFFFGAVLPDPAGILEGTGRFMRHVKVRPEAPVDEPALRALVRAAYADLRARASRP
jgi:hypothetical protein